MRKYLPPDISVEVSKGTKSGANLTTIAGNIARASALRGDVFHITGDIHYAAAGLERHRSLLTIHDCGQALERTGLRRIARELIWYRMPCGRCQMISTISDATRQDLLEMLPKGFADVRVVPDCVSEAFSFAEQKRGSGKPVVLQVGTAANKNLTRVIEAVEGLDCVLSIIGRLNEQDHRRIVARGIDHRNIVDVCEAEVVAAYRECDVVVFASTFEGFGMPIIEANSVGRPVITSAVSPMRQVAGSAACLVDPFDVRDIRSALVKVLTDREFCQALVRSGLQNARRYSPKHVAASYAALYREIDNRAAGQ